jgi:general secretion pathway protein I
MTNYFEASLNFFFKFERVFLSTLQLQLMRLRPRPKCASQQQGFTLIEVLVALAIVALALMAGVRVSASLTHNAQRQSDAMLAQICADNALIQLRLSQQLPSVGVTHIACEQADQTFDVALTVNTTPNPAFRRVDAQVLGSQFPILRVTTVVGRY